MTSVPDLAYDFYLKSQR